MSLDDKEWDKLSKALFNMNPPKASDEFVEKVMSKLKLTDDETPSPLFFRWLVPTFGFSFAALALFLTFPSLNNTPTTEDLLYQNSSIQTISTLDHIPELPAVDEMLEI